MEKKLRKKIKKVAKKLVNTEEVYKAQELLNKINFMLEMLSSLKDYKIK